MTCTAALSLAGKTRGRLRAARHFCLNRQENSRTYTYMYINKCRCFFCYEFVVQKKNTSRSQDQTTTGSKAPCDSCKADQGLKVPHCAKCTQPEFLTKERVKPIHPLLRGRDVTKGTDICPRRWLRPLISTCFGLLPNTSRVQQGSGETSNFSRRLQPEG